MKTIEDLPKEVQDICIAAMELESGKIYTEEEFEKLFPFPKLPKEIINK